MWWVAANVIQRSVATRQSGVDADYVVAISITLQAGNVTRLAMQRGLFDALAMRVLVRVCDFQTVQKHKKPGQLN